jgi:hypothetical protein
LANPQRLLPVRAAQVQAVKAPLHDPPRCLLSANRNQHEHHHQRGDRKKKEEPQAAVLSL